MATLEEVYQKVLADEGERTALAETGGTTEGLQAFLAERGCEASLEEVREFLKAKQSRQGELADAELDSVAGGGCTSDDPGQAGTIQTVLVSMVGLGFSCLAIID